MNDVLLKYLKSDKLCIRYFGIKKKYIKCIVDIVGSSILKLNGYQRKCNKLISKFKVTNEHVIGRLKM